MEQTKERALQLALVSLLDKVRTAKDQSWSKAAFMEAASHVANVTPAEAGRFQTALVDLSYLIPGSNKRVLKPNFDVSYWSNTDAMLGFIKEIMDVSDLIRTPGPKKGTPRVVNTQALSVHDLDDLTLITELRSRGWTVDAYKEVVQVVRL